MILVFNIKYCYDYERTYVVHSLSKLEGKQKAFKAFKESTTCNIPDSLEEAEKDESFLIRFISKADGIIL